MLLQKLIRVQLVIIASIYMTFKCQLPCSQKLASGPIISHTIRVIVPTTCLFKVHVDIFLSSEAICCSFQVADFNFLRISHRSDAFYMSRPSHPPWFENFNTIWWISRYEVKHKSVQRRAFHSSTEAQSTLVQVFPTFTLFAEGPRFCLQHYRRFRPVASGILISDGRKFKNTTYNCF